MKRYEAYKPTSVEWYPAIPQEWEWRYLFQIAHEQTIKKPVDEMYPVMTLSYGEIKRKKNTEAGLVPSNYDSYQMLYKGNIVLRLIDLQNDHTSLRTGLVKETGIITSAYTCIMPTENPAYIQYLLHSYDTKKVFYGYGGGVRQSIGFKDIRHLRVPVPPREEQDQIVRYLDWQVSKINRLIATKRKQIALISAAKYAFASSLVTKGLDDSCAIRYSGVNWLGDIPKHWQIRKLRTILHPVSEKNRPDLPLLSVVREKGVIPRDVDDKESNHNYIPDDLSGYKVVRTHQFVINKMKAWQGSYGIAPCDGIVSPAYFVFSIDFDNLEYFHHAIRSKVYVNFFAQASDGIRVGQWDLSIDKMKDIPFILPPSDEQTAIVESIKKNNAQADTTISALEKQIAVLQELRTRLISDVVTGQVDVRGIEVPEYEKFEEVSSADKEFEDIEERMDVE